MVNIKGKIDTSNLKSSKALDFIREIFSKYDLNDKQSEQFEDFIGVIEHELTELKKDSYLGVKAKDLFTAKQWVKVWEDYDK